MKVTSKFRLWLVGLGLPVTAVGALLAMIQGATYLCGSEIGEPCHDSESCSSGLLCTEGACHLPCDRQLDCPDDWSCRTPKARSRRLPGVRRANRGVCVRPATGEGGEALTLAPALKGGLVGERANPRPLQGHWEQIRQLHWFSELHPALPWTVFETRWRTIPTDQRVSDHELRELLIWGEGSP